MEDYIRGIVCGYLVVQSGTRDDAKRRRMFAVLSDARMDFYLKDPRPSFDDVVADTLTFKPSASVHRYAELNPNAPPHSFCINIDKRTDVFMAETAQDEETWISNIKERLDALATMLCSALLLRKELSATQQLQRLVLHTKFKWKERYFELGRSAICIRKSQNEKTQKINKQFALTSESAVAAEPVLIVQQSLVTTTIPADAQTLKRHARVQREQSIRLNQNTEVLKETLVYPFVVCTGQAHLMLAASTEKLREEWIMAIKLRVIQLKYRTGHGKSTMLHHPSSLSLRGFMDVQTKAGGDWKRRFVELENDLLKVKTNERQVGATFETTLIPSCHVATTNLLKPNAFVIRNLGRELYLAPSTTSESVKWMQCIRESALRVDKTRYQKAFEHDVQSLLRHSFLQTVLVEPGTKANMVVLKQNKRVAALSHQISEVVISDSKKPKQLPKPVQVKSGSMLVTIEEFGFVYESFENMWHRLRQKKAGQQHPMTLTFRAPYTRTGLVKAKARAKDPWSVRRLCVQHGKLTLASIEGDDRVMQWQTPLAQCEVEMVSEDAAGLPNCLKIWAKQHTQWFVHVPQDGNLFLWYAILHLETAIARGDPRYPIACGPSVSKKKPQDERQYQTKCTILGKSIVDILMLAEESDRKLQQGVLAASDLQDVVVTVEDNGVQHPPLTSEEAHAFFSQLDALGCGKVSSAHVAFMMDALTRHVDCRANALTAFHSSLQKLLEAAETESVLLQLEQFEQVIKNVSDPQAIEMIRSYCRGEVECL